MKIGRPNMNSNLPSLADKHVVVLINYMRKHHVLTYREFAKHVGKLTILVSTRMEDDRAWQPDWQGLNVIVQKNTTVTLNRNSGFNEKNFIHIPWDTISQLRKLKPDMILSYEMGARTLMSSVFRKLFAKVPFVLVGNMSFHLEKDRGILRRGARRIIRNSVDLATYNGPSCKKYLKYFGFKDSELAYFPYCYDPDKTFTGDKVFSSERIKNVLFCGSLSERKAVVPFAESLHKYCDANPDHTLNLIVAGEGDQKQAVLNLASENLSIEMLGNCSNTELQDAYRRADVCGFPTLGDEWGLVPIEAWASGLPVIGSKYSQSVEAICKHGVNGWIFDPKDPQDLYSVLEEVLQTPPDHLAVMGDSGREFVKRFSPQNSAQQLSEVYHRALKKHKKTSVFALPKTSETSPESPTITANPSPLPPATLSLDLDNRWAYLKSHNNVAWESHPSYFDVAVPRIISLLDQMNVKATFFVVGQDAVIEENKKWLKQIADSGHEIANHSFHHEPCLHLYTPEQLDYEMSIAEQAIHDATGRKPIGFRGPGFSISDQTLNALARRGYKYDCTMFPTYVATLARTFYFMTGSFSKKQKRDRNALFGKFSDGFLPNSPYLWQTESGDILEIPVTTFPGIKTPVHATYLHFLASFSQTAANLYFKSALKTYRMTGIAPSFLLHPLDFLGIDDQPDLAFFPGMKVKTKSKLQRIQSYIETYCKSFDVLTLQEYSSLTMQGQLSKRSHHLARTGIS